MAGKAYFGASYWGPSYFGADVVGVVPPVYGDPQFHRVVRASTRRVGATPDQDGADRIGTEPLATARRIGRTIQ